MPKKTLLTHANKVSGKDGWQGTNVKCSKKTFRRSFCESCAQKEVQQGVDDQSCTCREAADSRSRRGCLTLVDWMQLSASGRHGEAQDVSLPMLERGTGANP